MKDIVCTIVLFTISLLFFVLSIRSFLGKGVLLNNAYLYASKQEREAMDKRPYYRQTAIVFFMLALVFLLNGFAVLLRAEWVFYIVIALILIALVYAVISGIMLEKK